MLNPRKIGAPITLEWLLSNSKQVGECLEWQGQLFENGYGSVWIEIGKAKQLAHRLVAKFVYGESDKDVLHSCDNRCCINPAHLSYDSHSQNMLDCRDHGAGIHTQKLTREQAFEIKYKSIGSNVAIGKQYGVHPTTISNIRNGWTWKDI